MTTNEYLVATVTVTKVMTDDDVLIYYEAVDADGDDIPVIDTVGMLEFAKHSVLTPTDLFDDVADSGSE